MSSGKSSRKVLNDLIMLPGHIFEVGFNVSVGL